MSQETIPVFAIAYGPTGHGKTLDDLYSFPNALYIPINADSVRGSETVCGYQLRPDQVAPAWTLSDATATLEKIRDAGVQQGSPLYPQIVVDDLSMLAKHELKAMKESGVYTRGDGYTYDLWTDLADRIADFVRLARHDLRCHVVTNAHERPEETRDGSHYTGGPLLPSRKLTADIPHAATSVYRTAMEKTRQPWGGVYKIKLSRQFHTKCRLGYQGTIPMNLAELWRGVGIRVDRHPDLVWMEPYVEAVARKLAGGEKIKKVAARVLEKLPDADPRHVQWILRDGQDRAIIRKMRKKQLLSWVI